MHDRIIQLFLFYPLFLFSLSVHETAHAWMSNRFGDSTAKDLGRVTLNPLPHMDVIGTAFLPIFGILTGFPIIGWGKPVPVNGNMLKNPRKDHLWIAAVGPISNVLVAGVCAVLSWGLLALIPQIFSRFPEPGTSTFSVLIGIKSILEMGVIINLLFAAFNMLPFFPLDGSAVLRGLLPESMVQGFDRFSRYGMIILLVLFVAGLLRYVLIPVFAVAKWMLP